MRASDLYLRQPERDRIPPQDQEERQVFTRYWIFYNRDGWISFGMETRGIFGSLAGRSCSPPLNRSSNCDRCGTHSTPSRKSLDIFILLFCSIAPQYPIKELVLPLNCDRAVVRSDGSSAKAAVNPAPGRNKMPSESPKILMEFDTWA